ncbi:hypothetical protein LUZ60_010044 [Juncus effusus]|nr:hypothetical protein LUZ60_010044 [Juncus effusus]
MESNLKTSSKTTIKDKLARMFRRNYCNSNSSISVSLSSGNTSRRTLLSENARNPSRSLSALDHRKTHESPSIGAVSARVSIDCGVCRPNRDSFVRLKNPNLQPLVSTSGVKKERRVRENGGLYETVTGTGTAIGTRNCEGRTCPPASPSSSRFKNSSSYRIYNSLNKDCKRKITKKRLCNNPYGFSESSSSSMESEGGNGFFTSDEETGGAHKAETETFFSSKSFSSDSSEFYSKPLPNHNNGVSKKKRNKAAQRKRRVSSCNGCNIKEGFKPLVAMASKEKKDQGVKKGFAVVKKSSDPYGDFRNSMVEMIIERQIFGSGDLEKLLHSYLSLNSARHHPVILQAFSDIWVVLFGN